MLRDELRLNLPGAANKGTVSLPSVQTTWIWRKGAGRHQGTALAPGDSSATQPCGITKTSGMSALFQNGGLASVTVERRTISRLD